MTEVSWIAADWGTTNLRIWGMSGQNDIVAHAGSDKGMNRLKPGEFEAALLELAGDWLDDKRQTLVVACGMVGARQGWTEADYVTVPTSPLTRASFTVAPITDARLRVLIVPGLAQHDPADVMRGEETQIAGLLAQRPDFEGLVCIPGTHSKWAEITGGTITSFRTFMTGEMFDLLEHQSILRHSLNTAGLDETAFEEAIAAKMSSPDAPLADLFSIRAGDLLIQVPSPISRAKLSASLIAAELGAMKAGVSGRKVSLIASGELGRLYKKALEVVGKNVEMVDGNDLAVRGLAAAKALIEETP